MIKSIGEILREKREFLTIPKAQINRDIQICEEYLEYLENNQFEKLPGSFYVKSFLKRYSKYLGLNTEHILASYRRDFEISSIDDRLSKKVNIVKNKKANLITFLQIKKIISSKYLLLFIGISVLLTSLVFYINSLISGAFKPPMLKIYSPIEISSGYEGVFEVSRDLVDIKGKVDPNTSLFFNEKIVTTDIDQSFILKNILVTSEGTNINLVAESPLGTKSQIKLIIKKVIPNIDTMELRIYAVRDVSNIKVFGNGVNLFEGDLKEYEVKLFNTTSIFEIKSEDESNLVVEINNNFYNLKNGTIFENKGTVLEQKK